MSYIYANDEQMVTHFVQESNRPLLLLATEMTLDDVRPFLKAHTPLLVLDSEFLNLGFHTVAINNYQAGYLAAEYFMERGHTDMGVITSSRMFNNARDRWMGFEAALKMRNMSLKDENVFRVDPTVEGAFQDMSRILEERTLPMPTAVFSVNDIVAAGCIRAMKSHGIKVPYDVSIIGMDNLPTAMILNPPLTTVNVPKFMMGSLAVETLIRLSDGEEHPLTHTVMDVHIIERSSVRDLRDLENEENTANATDEETV